MVGGAEETTGASEVIGEVTGTGAGRRGCGGMAHSSLSRPFQSAERVVVATVMVKSLSTESNRLKLPVASRWMSESEWTWNGAAVQ